MEWESIKAEVQDYLCGVYTGARSVISTKRILQYVGPWVQSQEEFQADVGAYILETLWPSK